MEKPQPTASRLRIALALLGLALLPGVTAQISKPVFTETFSANTIDPSRFAPDAPFFEGGVGDIAASQHDGVLEFAGTVSQQWWAGATLRVLPTFAASPETNLVVSVDRVAEAGAGTASRSALWIMDATQSYYVLYADVRGEGGWHYNRKIGIAGDNPTGGGTDIPAFNGGTYDNGGEHRMKAVANGSTVTLYLDGVKGAEVKFPFSQILFHLGSYARANNDTANTIFDNLLVEQVGTATFSATALTLGLGQTATGIKVTIPPGANATQAVTLRVVSSNPAAANAAGATGNTLTLTFPAGGSNQQTFDIQSVDTGGSRFTLTNDFGLGAGNFLQVTVVPGPGVRLTDTFTGASLDAAKWEVNLAPFETGEGTYEVVQTGGQLKISGVLDVAAYWDGASVRTVNEYIATPDLPLSFEMDRVSVNNLYFDVPASAVRTGVFITTADRSQSVFFGQDLGETGWQVNVNPGNPTGSGTALPAFADLAADQGNHRLRLVANGSTVEVFLDGQSGGTFPFAVSSGIRFEVGAYSRDLINPDFVEGIFDNVRVENTLPCITASPANLAVLQGDASATIKVTLPKLLNAANTTVTLTSSAPGVAVPEGAVGGVRTLIFPAGSTNAQTVKVVTTGTGTAEFTLGNDQGVCVGSPVVISVTPPPVVLVSDEFAGAALDAAKWTLDPAPLVPGGTATAESATTVTGGVVDMSVTCEVTNWPGFTAWTQQTYDASAQSPVAFEIDRVAMNVTLVGGTNAKGRTGVWVRDAAGHYVFFSDLASFDNAPSRGWQYHRFAGQAGDVLLGANPDTTGTFITTYDTPKYADSKNHRMRIVANGSTVKLYLDDVFGAEVAFPFAQGLQFGFGSYVNLSNAVGNVIRASWDNAVIKGFPPVVESRLSIVKQGADVVLTWTGTGTLQSSTALGSAAAWTNVTPAPAGNTYTTQPAGQARFYRVQQ